MSEAPAPFPSYGQDAKPLFLPPQPTFIPPPSAELMMRMGMPEMGHMPFFPGFPMWEMPGGYGLPPHTREDAQSAIRTVQSACDSQKPLAVNPAQPLPQERQGENQEEEEDTRSPPVSRPLAAAPQSTQQLAMFPPKGQVTQIPNMISSKRDAAEVFALVPGRFTLLNQTTKYKVTIGEIQRRINAPECLHGSLINTILRKGKSKNNGPELRSKLASVGLSVPCGRRKLAGTTAFTALTEDEAVNLGKDFAHLCETAFQSHAIADHLVREKEKGGDLPQQVADLKLISSFFDELSTVATSMGDHPATSKPRSNVTVDCAVNHFSLMTHGFGSHAVSGFLGAMKRVAVDSSHLMESKISDPRYAVATPKQ